MNMRKASSMNHVKLDTFTAWASVRPHILSAGWKQGIRCYK